jgi:hypothetical protein
MLWEIVFLRVRCWCQGKSVVKRPGRGNTAHHLHGGGSTFQPV